MPRKPLVLGRATQDLYIKYAQLLPEGIRLFGDEGETLDLTVHTPPIRPGNNYYHKGDSPSIEQLASFPHQFRIGGGGFNSMRELQTLASHAELPMELRYLDPSTGNLSALAPHASLGDVITGYGGIPLFLGVSEIPIHIMVGTGNDKVIVRLKGYNTNHGMEHVQTIEDALADSDAVLINSLKDEALIARVLEKNLPTVASITKSIPGDRVRDIFGGSHAVCVYNFDELHPLFGHHQVADEDLRVAYAQNVATELLGGANFYITLGKHGALASDGKTIEHISLHDADAHPVQDALRNDPTLRNGAGDFFAAAVLYFERQGRSPVDTARLAAQAVMRDKFGHDVSADQYKARRVA